MRCRAVVAGLRPRAPEPRQKAERRPARRLRIVAIGGRVAKAALGHVMMPVERLEGLVLSHREGVPAQLAQEQLAVAKAERIGRERMECRGQPEQQRLLRLGRGHRVPSILEGDP